MKAAVLREFGHPPRVEEFPDPTAGAGESVIRIRASVVSHLVRGVAAGRHYGGSRTLPFILGVDGIGVTDDGRRVYASAPRSPYGTMAELTVVPQGRLIPVPDGLDDVSAAALPNAALAAWLAFSFRARLAAGERVLILGATGAAGRLAIPIARHLGASRVVAAGRNPEVLRTLAPLGADSVLSLTGSDAEIARAIAEEHATHPVDVVLDFIWGHTAEIVIASFTGRGRAATVPRVRYVSVGAMAGDTAALSSASFRSSGLELLGSGIGSVADADTLATIPKIWALARAGRLPVATEPVHLADVEAIWSRPETGSRRVVVVP